MTYGAWRLSRKNVQWLTSKAVMRRLVPEPTRVITVGDREADLYELLSQVRSCGSEFLIQRATIGSLVVRAVRR